MISKIILFLYVGLSFISAEQQIVGHATIIDSLSNLKKKSPERAIRYARLLLAEEELQNSDFEPRIYNLLGEIYLDIGLPSLALTNFIEYGLRTKSKKSPWNKINIGNVYFMEEKWIIAKEKYLEALDYFRKFNQSKPNTISGKAVALSNLGRIEMHLENYDDALVYFKEALNVKRGSARYKMFFQSKSGPNISYGSEANGVAYQHWLLATLYAKWNIYDMALEQLQVSDSILYYLNSDNVPKTTRFSSKIYLGKNHSLRTQILFELNNYDGAYQESKLAIGLLKESPIKLARHYKIESDIFIGQNELYGALEAIDEGLKICELNGLSALEIDLLNHKLEILKANKLDKSALDISKTIIDKKTILSNNRMHMLLESLNYKAELAVNRKKLDNAKERELILFIIVGCSVIFLGFVVQNNRNRRIAASQEALIQKQKRELMENKLKNKENELMKMSAYIVSKNDLLHSIEKDLIYHSSLIENASDRRLMNPLKKKIKNKIDDSADWEQFQMQFAITYPGFIDLLTTSFSVLRSSDLKICCYLKMNMNTKEIARITGLSVRAIENKRYRLRKKLNLTKEISLESFIHSLKNENE